MRLMNFSLLLCLASIPLSAADRKPLDKYSALRYKTFAELDTNRDGYIQITEWPDYRKLYLALDDDGDGRLSAAEYFERGDAMQRAERFKQWDRNRDGVLSGLEWQSDPELFSSLDKNSDNVLSFREFAAHDIYTRFRDFDKNRDGVIAADEWSRNESEFRALDEDSDKRVTAEEYFAQGDQPVRMDRFREWDRNSDYRLEGYEWKGSQQLFREFDSDRDSTVSYAEYMGLAQVDPQDERWVALDRNNDGTISPIEWKGDAYVFALLDRNQDKRLSSDEFLNPCGEMMLDRLDRNRDGLVVRAEWTGAAQTFAHLDRNGDGNVDSGELAGAVSLSQTVATRKVRVASGLASARR